MATYTPPTEDFSYPDSFNPIVFRSADDSITIAEGDTRYLRFPVSQGSETISGNLTITGEGFCSTVPTGNTSLANKLYVDNAVVGGSILGTNNTWTGTNAFNTSLPTSTQTPTTSTELTTKTYVDSAISGASILGLNNTFTGINTFTNTTIANQIEGATNTDIVVEGKGTGDVILKTGTTNRITCADNGGITIAGGSGNPLDITTTGNITLQSATGTNINIGNTQTSGTINIGVNSSSNRTGAINLGTGAGAGAPATQLNWGTSSNTGQLTFQGGSFTLTSTGNYTQRSGNTFNTSIDSTKTSGETLIAAGNSQTGKIDIGTGTGIKIMNLGGTATTLNLDGSSITAPRMTFNTSLPTSTQTPTTSTELTTKTYVDSAVSGASILGTNNTFTGTNAFNTSLPTSTQTPTTSTELTTKTYVDSSISGASILGTNNTFTGTNAFNTSLPTSTQTPTTSTELTTKTYVDSAVSGASILGTNNTFTGTNAFGTMSAGATTLASASITGLMSSATATVSGLLTAGSATITGALSAGASTLASASITGLMSSATATVSGLLTAGSATISGALSAGASTLSSVVSNTYTTTSTASTASLFGEASRGGNINIGIGTIRTGNINIGNGGGVGATGNISILTNGTGTTTIGNASSTNTIVGTTSITGDFTMNTSGTADTIQLGNNSAVPVSIIGEVRINAPTNTQNTSIGNTTGTLSLVGDVNYTDGDFDFATTTTNNLTPTSTVLMLLTSTVPTGWLYCDGSAISRSTYSRLFAVIGTTFGVGNGSTTFNIPNFKGAFLRGNDTQTVGGIAYTAAAVGTAQQDSVLEAYNEGFWNVDSGGGGSNRSVRARVQITADPEDTGANSTTKFVRQNSTENRVFNFAVYYYIKF